MSFSGEMMAREGCSGVVGTSGCLSGEKGRRPSQACGEREASGVAIAGEVTADRATVWEVEGERR
jgi:hypothetical protein